MNAQPNWIFDQGIGANANLDTTVNSGIADNGSAMSEAVKKKIFDPFLPQSP